MAMTRTLWLLFSLWFSLRKNELKLIWHTQGEGSKSWVLIFINITKQVHAYMIEGDTWFQGHWANYREDFFKLDFKFRPSSRRSQLRSNR